MNRPRSRARHSTSVAGWQRKHEGWYCAGQSRTLNQNFFDRIAVVDIQALLAWNFQAAWIESQLMEHGGVDVGYVVAVLHGVEAEFVRGAVDDASLDACAGHPDRESVGIVVASVGAFAARCAAEFSGPDH